MEHGILLLLHALLKWAFPLRQGEAEDPDGNEVRPPRLRWMWPLALVLFLASLVPWTLGWFAWCLHLEPLRRSLAGPCRFLIVPPRSWWMLPVAGLATVSAYLTMRVVIALALGPGRNAAYRRHESRGCEFDVGRAARVFGRLLVALSLLALAYQVGHYTKFTDRAIVVRGAIGLGEVARPYSSIRAVGRVRYARVKTGRPRVRPHFLIRFVDGSTWESWQQTEPGGRPGESRAVAFAATKSGRPLQRVDFDEELGR